MFYPRERNMIGIWNMEGCWPPSMPPLPMFLIAPLAVTEDVTMEATTTVTLSIFSDLVFYLALQYWWNVQLWQGQCELKMFFCIFKYFFYDIVTYLKDFEIETRDTLLESLVLYSESVPTVHHVLAWFAFQCTPGKQAMNLRKTKSFILGKIRYLLVGNLPFLMGQKDFVGIRTIAAC